MELEHNLHGDYAFTPSNVFQRGSSKNRATIGSIISPVLLPGSRIDNVEALVELDRRCQAGESCLVLAEHYSNFDYPVLYYLVEHSPQLGPKTVEKFLPIRGMKLSETSPIMAIFTRSYDSIIIYPSRTMDEVDDLETKLEMRKIGIPINRAAIREMIFHKHNGRIIIVFPSGTRYRSWKPSTRKGVREINSYMKLFDNIVFISINGNTLPPNETDDMTQEQPVEDLMILTCSDIINGRQFKKEVERSTPEGKDSKQHVVDMVMERLFAMHDKVEPGRLAERDREYPENHR